MSGSAARASASHAENRGFESHLIDRRSSDRPVAEILTLLGVRHWHRGLVRSDAHGSVMSSGGDQAVPYSPNRAVHRQIELRAWVHTGKFPFGC